MDALPRQRSWHSSSRSGEVLAAPDADELVDWLRRRPLMHYDAGTKRVLVHAGLPPGWTVTQARAQARDVEALLRGRNWRASLRTMYGNEPSAWSRKLGREDQRRYTINALTRMRYCDRRGRLELSESGPPGSQPKGLTPWFDMPERRSRGAHIVFGHWAALGVLRRADVTGLDSGCVWGGCLTAVRLDKSARPVRVTCTAAILGRDPRPRR